MKTESDAMSCLRNGALSRSTGETQMNQQSSRLVILNINFVCNFNNLI